MTVRLGWGSGSITDAGIIIAQERGYFSSEGLKIDYQTFNTSDLMSAPLAAGQLDVGTGTLSVNMLNSIVRGIPVRIVADRSSHREGFRSGYFMLRKDLADQFKSWADLKGKKVGVIAVASSGAWMVDSALRRGGLTYKDVELVQLDFPSMGVALSNKSIDGALVVEPFVTQFLEKGFAALTPDGKELWPDFQAGILNYGPQFIDSQAEAAKRFMVGYLRGVRDYNAAFHDGKDKEAVIDMLIKNTALKDRAIYDKISYPGIDPNGQLHVENLDAQQTFFVENGFQQQKVDFSKVIDYQFVNYALGRLGKV